MREKLQEISHVESVLIFSLKTIQNFNEAKSILGRFGHLAEVFDHYSDKKFRFIGIFLFGLVYRLLFKDIISFFIRS